MSSYFVVSQRSPGASLRNELIVPVKIPGASTRSAKIPRSIHTVCLRAEECRDSLFLNKIDFRGTQQRVSGSCKDFQEHLHGLFEG